MYDNVDIIMGPKDIEKEIKLASRERALIKL